MTLLLVRGLGKALLEEWGLWDWWVICYRVDAYQISDHEGSCDLYLI